MKRYIVQVRRIGTGAIGCGKFCFVDCLATHEHLGEFFSPSLDVHGNLGHFRVKLFLHLGDFLDDGVQSARYSVTSALNRRLQLLRHLIHLCFSPLVITCHQRPQAGYGEQDSTGMVDSSSHDCGL